MPMNVFRLNSLRGRLILLVALAITPMVAMTVLTGVREREHAIEVARENLQRVANLAAANEAQSLEGARQILRDLSSVPDVLGDQHDCSVLMSDILSKNLDYVNFGLIRLNGDVTCSAVASIGMVNLGDRAHFQRAISERRFVASNYVFGRVIGKHTVNLTYPVIKKGEVVGVLFAAMDLTELDKFVLDVQLSPGAVLWTADSQGTIISRRPDPGPWFGKKLPAPLQKGLLHPPKTPILIADDDGVERMYAFARVGRHEVSDYTVMIGIPQEEIVAAAQRDQLIATIGLAATVTLALLAAWFGGDVLIVRRVQALARTANRIASGSLDTRTGMQYENEEISDLARSLDDMALALQKKEWERDAAAASLQAADKRKDEFLAMLAHELRNPLAPISSGAQVLKMAHGDNPSVARTADIISRQVEHMTRLIDDLLDVSRVTRGLVKLNRQVLDLRHVVEDAVEQTYPLFKSKRQQLNLDLPDEAQAVGGDHKRLVQVVANLLNNAAKYTPEHGQIDVRLRRDGERVRLQVEDDGIGMTRELCGRVFELFTQGERTSDRSQGGLGLGLALVRTLVLLHGGTVRAESAGPDRGSQFTIELPAAQGEVAPGLDQPAEHSLPPQHGLRCLVVDDNVDAAQTLALFLEAAGHRVFIAHRATEAIELARATAPQICFLDIGLPDIDGYQLAEHLRQLPQTGRCQLIAVTGYGRKEDQDRALAAGFDHYFVKPLDTSKLVHLLGVMAGEPA
ncbi:ATP-binding protein [Massilia sp. YIM B04103]|uniref:hybrid sensor histidine kinase/response regulator n=1 Tax=Massilia sp. YIM B04103 TaxID=2963106 RepID=UPI00210CF143|nr:ATP-binding protein [Massilia sp. YIM B04103]